MNRMNRKLIDAQLVLAVHAAVAQQTGDDTVAAVSSTIVAILALVVWIRWWRV